MRAIMLRSCQVVCPHHHGDVARRFSRQAQTTPTISTMATAIKCRLATPTERCRLVALFRRTPRTCGCGRWTFRYGCGLSSG
eukprot:scaffold28812_cov47-Prasinocladus_malaysianus.AAC.2